MNMKSLIFLMMTCGMAMAADAPAMRKQAAELETQGNWREAYELRVKILREVDDAESGTDLQQALQSQRQLGEPQNFDPLLAELTESKKDNPAFMQAAGSAFLFNHGSYGQILDGGFQRGMNGRGNFIGVQEQDRLRALQCFLQAHLTVEKGGAKEVEILSQIGNALTLSHTGSGNVWRLQLLTDVKAVPDYTERIDTITSEGAPVDAEGNPSWINVPESWETAASDGERWRWTMKEIVRIDPQQAAAEGLQWFQFCQAHFDVNTLASFGWWGQPEVKERDGILQASTLKETETIARLANGVKRFTLREDHQFIPGLRTLMRMGKEFPSAQAGISWCRFS